MALARCVLACFPLALLLALALCAPNVVAVEGLPTAPGDSATVDIEFVETLPPGTARSVDVTVRFCAASSGLIGGARQVALAAIDAPAWLAFEFEPATFTFAVPLPGDCDDARGLARLNASRDAPGFEIVTVPVVARDATGSWEYGRVEYGFRVGYAGAMRVAPLEARVPAPLGEPVPVALRVTNEGNADTTFLLQMAGTRDDAHVLVPEPLRLAPGESDEWSVRVVAPAGSGMEERAIDLLVTSHATLDHRAAGESAVVRVTIVPEASSRGFAMPAPAAAWALAALAAVALASRR